MKNKETEKNKNKKDDNCKKCNKYITICLAVVVVILAVLLCVKCFNSKLPKLPLPEVTGGERGMLGIDKNINEETIDNYLGREDSVYRDVRMLIDDGNYESIGGDSYLSGFVKGFEVVPYPYLAPLSGLPESVGKGYTGKTLFSVDENGTYIPNYTESLDVLEYLFPKDKNIFLMCGGGGYAGMTKTLLVSLGWDGNKIYNTGGYWNYKGNNSIQVYNEKEKVHDFWKVSYHNIDFSRFKPVKGEK